MHPTPLVLLVVVGGMGLGGCLDAFDHIPPCHDVTRVIPKVVAPDPGARYGAVRLQVGEPITIAIRFDGCPQPELAYHWHVVPDRGMAGGPEIERRIGADMEQTFVFPYLGAYEIAVDFGSSVEPWFSSDLEPDPEAPFNPYANAIPVEVYEEVTHPLPRDGSSFSHAFTTFCCPFLVQVPRAVDAAPVSVRWEVDIVAEETGHELYRGQQLCAGPFGMDWKGGAWLEPLRVTWTPLEEAYVPGVHRSYEVDFWISGRSPAGESVRC